MPIDEILAIIRMKGSRLDRGDMRSIEIQLAAIPLDDVHEIEAWVREAVELIVADPLYEGDLDLATMED